jgi:quinol-cytochrome oxidoreductase complex cytochrome b subunit
MKVNESKTDRIIRVVVGVIFLVLFLTNTVAGILGTILLVLGIILLVTGFLGFCPLYTLLKISTNK